MIQSRVQVLLLAVASLVAIFSCSESEDQELASHEVSNLTAFAKLYGHVKYFHPSDEAREIDWDRFAIYGARAVKQVNNDDELMVVLDSLFKPIAPTVTIRNQKSARNPFLPHYIQQLDQDTSQLNVVAWQHIGLDQAGDSRSYSSARLHRPSMDSIGKVYPDSTTRLFDEYPKAGETTVKELKPGVWSEVPLALFGDDAHTLPRVDEATLNRLSSQLDAINIDSLSVEDESVRLANIIIAWNILQHFYPYWDVVETDWDQELVETLVEAINDESSDEFYTTFRNMLAAVQDGHIWLFHPSQNESGIFPFVVDWIENQVVVTRSIHNQIKPGDIVQAVDGVPAAEMVESEIQLVSGSPQLARFRVMRRFGIGKEGSNATVTVTRDGERREYSVERSSLRSNQVLYESDRPKIYEIENKIFYVDLDRASMEEINEQLDQISAAQGVIFDLRGYPNGNHQILSHLLSTPDTSDQWMQKPQIIYPNLQTRAGYSKLGWSLKPAAPHIQGNVAFITSGRAISYAESVMGFVEHYKLGEIVGQSTAGTNGNINRVNLPGGYAFNFTGMRVLKHDGSQHHLIGIQPTVPVEQTIAGVREGRDEYLEKALEVVRDG